MKKRPLSIRILSLAFLMAPIGLLFELMYLYKIPLEHWTAVFTPSIWNAQVIAIAVITPLVGLCVWTVHRWCYIVLLGFSGLILANNLALWITGHAGTGIVERIFLTLGLLAIVLVELRKEFAAPYFNPRLRWWEQARRYRADRLRIIVREPETGRELFEASSFDVSVTGIYVASDHATKIGDSLTLDLLLPEGKSCHATGQVVWVNPGSGRIPQGFGCRFTAAGDHFKTELRALIAEIHAELRPR